MLNKAAEEIAQNDSKTHMDLVNKISYDSDSFL